MPFQPVASEKLSTTVVKQIEQLIMRGILRAGERLPSERDLSERMQVSRPSLREAISDLSEAGLLETRKGAGIFVSQGLDATFPDALVRLFATHEDAVLDTLDFRRDIEGLAAERAARFGSGTDLELIQGIMTKMERAHETGDSKSESELDALFHLAIIEAGHNVIMVHMMRALLQLLREGVVYNRQIMFQQNTTRAVILEQHCAIAEAITARDPVGARKAIERHLDYVKQALQDQIVAEKHDAVAQQRMSRQADL